MKGKGIALLILSASVWGCVEVRENQLYVEKPSSENAVFHASEDIYRDYITSEAWYTQADGCLDVRATPDASKDGDLGLHIKWNRVAVGCPWLGLGFGWDNWTGKDIQDIRNTGALQFYVKMPAGERGVLPWAIGFEDFTGAQAWLGMSENAQKSEKITADEWTRVELPLSEFNWDEQDANASNIKQLIIQFEADGEIFIDEIQLVPYSGGYRKRAILHKMTPEITFNVDGSRTDELWSTEPTEFDGHRVHLGLRADTLCIAAFIKDETPGRNSQSGREIYNGDAFEFAFSTDNTTASRRNNFRTTDRHYAVSLNPNSYSFDFVKNEMGYQESNVQAGEGGVWLEAKIWLDLGKRNMDVGNLYGLELAVDKASASTRDVQVRWNNPNVDGFYERPSLWGEMLVKELQEMYHDQE